MSTRYRNDPRYTYERIGYAHWRAYRDGEFLDVASTQREIRQLIADDAATTTLTKMATNAVEHYASDERLVDLTRFFAEKASRADDPSDAERALKLVGAERERRAADAGRLAALNEHTETKMNNEYRFIAWNAFGMAAVLTDEQARNAAANGSQIYRIMPATFDDATEIWVTEMNQRQDEIDASELVSEVIRGDV